MERSKYRGEKRRGWENNFVNKKFEYKRRKKSYEILRIV